MGKQYRRQSCILIIILFDHKKETKLLKINKNKNIYIYIYIDIIYHYRNKFIYAN